jgi:hypothetical protein
MSLGGISDYLKTNNISTPEDQSSTPYLPYAQQGPYQAIMSQMGNYGGSAGTGYQQGMGNVYGGGGAGGAMGGFNPDLYKRAAPAAPVVLPDMGGGNRGGGSGGDRSGAEGNGSYGSGFPASLAPYANTFANLLGDAGLNNASAAVSRALMSGSMSGSGAAPGSSFSPDAGAVNASSGGEYGGWGSRDAGGGFTGGSDAGAAARGGMGFGGTGSGISGDGGGDSRSFGRRDAGGDSGFGGDSSGDSRGWGSRDAGGLAKGGQVSMQHLQGPNPMGPDQGYGALKSGEFVINDKAVAKYGIDLMNAINSGKISKGKLRGLLEM